MGSASPGRAVVVEPGFVVFWHPDGTTPAGPGEPGTVDVVLRDGLRTVPARRVPIADAVTLLRDVSGDASAEFWSVAAQAGTRLAEAGWTGPLAPEEEQWLRRLADAMPPHAHATPLPGDPARLPEPFPVLLGFLRDVAGLAAATRVSLRLESDDFDGGRFRAVVQVHGDTLVDAEELWRTGAEAVRHEVLLVLRRCAEVWPPLAPLLAAPVPAEVALLDDDIRELLGDAAGRLAELGVAVHWPAQLAGLTARAVVRPGAAPDDVPAFFGGGRALELDWQLALGGAQLSAAELDVLAKARRPVVRLRDRWVLLGPASANRARERALKPLTPVDALAAVLAGTTEVDGAEVELVTDGWLATLRSRLAELPGPAPQPAGLTATLRDYQLRGLHWLDTVTSLGLGGCLADDMGLGKTLTLIALHLHRDAGPTLVVCPASLLGTWEAEIHRFAPGVAVRRFHGGARSLDELDGFVLTTYGTLRADPAPLAAVAWDLVVADEAQHVKNHRSGTAKALRTLRSSARVALTGTPVENTLSELWAILDWTTPGLLGTLTEFRARWAKPVETGSDPAAAERLSRLLRPFLLRRRKSDPGIAPELPAKTETDRPVALTSEQAALYEAAVRELLAEVGASAGMARRGRIVKLLTALKQICNHPAHYLAEGDDAPLSGRSGKLELLDELLDTILAEDGAVLVFTQYVVMARLLQRHLAGRKIPSQFLHGGTPVPQREELVRRFQDGAVPVFLLSLKAAGTGLTLTRADHVVHYDRWWNPAVEDQATDRAYRIGQTRPVQVHRLVAEGTVEDRIAALLREKRALADAVLAGGEAAFTELTDTELAELVQLRRPA
ncbi:DEAD/DEAH box helicase [Amycolatopsis sp. NPDC005232]|uniref:DEAD/DEAH box helicase n=1 Tax=Amycolatopsis sp. NPDC005232 TaxID=3157027 RepID=UPI0033BD107F